MRDHAFVTAWVGFLLVLGLLFVAPAQAGDGTVNVVGHFENGGVVAEIDTYTDNGVVVALKANGRLPFAFDKNDWPALEKLWR